MVNCEFVFSPIATWASQSPDRLAVVSRNRTWTYRELEDQTNQIARFLASKGVTNGSRVAFVMPRGTDAILLLVSILKAGACYVPLDSESAPGRIQDCLEDAKPNVVIVDDQYKSALPALGKAIRFSEVLSAAQGLSREPFDAGCTPDSLAYLIFTSGTTGRPKGVPIKHKSLSNFVIGDQETCIQLTAEDQVFQGFSPASDGHHEEVWPTFLVGATLVVATSKEVHSGVELQEFLNDFKVTVISCAPTLLSMVEGDVPTLRRILFGAESCPPVMVERWWTPTRAILNTYGPTEATIGATFGICLPGQPINIGKPLPGYHCLVLDENLHPVPAGQEGELAIAGVGVSDGYFGRPELNATKFVPLDRAKFPQLEDPRVYRTGDRVRVDEQGDLVWLGRVDNQVKIRGHRVELSDIESHVLADKAVKSAVVILRDQEEDLSTLVALVTLKSGVDFNFSEFLERMRGAVSSYMVPQSVELVDAIPTLPSGKIDRRACQHLRGKVLRLEREIVPPANALEEQLLGIWSSLLSAPEISCTDDFFTDLGGYSLLASKFISVMRSDHGYAALSVMDIYENPTIRSFAAFLSGLQTEHVEEIPFETVSSIRYTQAKVWQGIGVLLLFALQGFFWLGPLITAIYYSNNGLSDSVAFLVGVGLHIVSVPLLLAVCIVLKWVVAGRFKPGEYPMYGPEFLKWWFVGRVSALAPVSYLTGTPFATLYMRAMGAKVGKNVVFESLDVDCPDLIHIGDDCTFENSAWLRPSTVANGLLKIKPVIIENGCTVGMRSGVTGGGVLRTGATLADLSCASHGITVPEHAEWAGSPAQPAETRRIPRYDPASQPTQAQWFGYGVAQFFLLMILAALETFPFSLVAFMLYNLNENAWSYLSEPIFAIGLVMVGCLQAVMIKWSVLGKLKPGVYRFPGGLWLRKWFAEKHLDLISGVIVPVYDSLFARAWCRSLGMKCGSWCEIALPRRMPYDLFEMGEESFIASEVGIGMPIRKNGKLILERTSIGDRVFLGNDSVLPQGTDVPDGSLTGVLTVAPSNAVLGDKTGQAWLGSPAFRLPTRQVNQDFDVALTYRPSRKLYLERLMHEAFRIILPSACSLLVVTLMVESFVEIWDKTSIGVALAVSPLLYLLGALVSTVMILIIKAILVGKYRPTMQPLWSRYVWKVETYSAVLHDFGVPTFMTALVGTPFLSGLMRVLGANIGKRTFINTTDFTETDLIQIGEDVAINANAPLQAHLFEDRVMKIGPIKIGDRSSIGCYSVVLCDSVVKPDVQLGDLSLVMKGETLPSHSSWVGAPAKMDVSAGLAKV